MQGLQGSHSSKLNKLCCRIPTKHNMRLPPPLLRAGLPTGLANRLTAKENWQAFPLPKLETLLLRMRSCPSALGAKFHPQPQSTASASSCRLLLQKLGGPWKVCVEKSRRPPVRWSAGAVSAGGRLAGSSAPAGCLPQGLAHAGRLNTAAVRMQLKYRRLLPSGQFASAFLPTQRASPY